MVRIRKTITASIAIAVRPVALLRGELVPKCSRCQANEPFDKHEAWLVFLRLTRATAAAMLVNYLIWALGDIPVNGSDQETVFCSMAIAALPFALLRRRARNKVQPLPDQ